jgi:P27 family predicted phage terminase small subunit
MSKPTRTRSAPPALSAEARELWVDIMKSHVVDDGASRALLRQLCESLDGLRAVQARIKQDGLMIAGSKGQARPHPLLVSEAEFRRAILACVRGLRLDISAEVTISGDD